MEFVDHENQVRWRPLRELADELGRSPQTLHKWVQRGHVEAKKITYKGKPQTWVSEDDVIIQAGKNRRRVGCG